MSNVGIKRPCECTIAHDISLENVSRMHELSEAFHAISLRHTCLMSILEQFSKLSSRAGDLSFNKLNGEIPNLDGLTNVEVMCLTGNRLNGNIPDGIKGRQSRTEIDLSYSNFSEQSALPSCRDSLQELFLSKLNLVKL
ncbi:receptor-like protein 34 isoform X1 [Vitis vinifera]|nr:receptor-like protein 34 isoform X1 [Vitis vinifera]